jgi:hypothetical protein
MEGFERYALYYAPPPDTQLAQLGNAWLGCDPASGDKRSGPTFAEMPSERLSHLLATPARYGFHGTIKAPFRLPKDATLSQLDETLSASVKTTAPVICNALKIRKFSNFYALCPVDAHAQIQDLAANFVRLLEPFRAPLDAFELARRRKTNLSAVQEKYLVNWGYPFVFEEFRFHMTLSGNVPNPEQKVFEAILENYWAPVLKEPFRLSQLCLFGDPGGGLPFKLLKRYELAQGF